MAWLWEPPRQASPATQGLPRAMETKAVLTSYLQLCYWAKWGPRSPGHPERGEGEEGEGGLLLPGLCQPGRNQWDRIGRSCGFWGLDCVRYSSGRGRKRNNNLNRNRLPLFRQGGATASLTIRLSAERDQGGPIFVGRLVEGIRETLIRRDVLGIL